MLGPMAEWMVTRRHWLRAVAAGTAGTAGTALLAGDRAAGAALLGGDRAAVPVCAAPAGPLPVDRRQYAFARSPERPLRTVLWTPAPPGRYPLLLFSHGLHGSPERFAGLSAGLAAAGFVVAAPAYPHTSAGAAAFSSDDMPNQPADASFVISEVLALRLPARPDPARVGAIGHSAGGYTTAGLLASRSRDPRIRAAVVLSGGAMNGRFTGPSADVLFVHGDRDEIVPYPVGRAAYRAVPWSKAFLTFVGVDHESYLFKAGPAAVVTARAVLDFLRGSLDEDHTALVRFAADATVAGVTRLDRSPS
jgi:dienelactone hydrolase